MFRFFGVGFGKVLADCGTTTASLFRVSACQAFSFFNLFVAVLLAGILGSAILGRGLTSTSVFFRPLFAHLNKYGLPLRASCLASFFVDCVAVCGLPFDRRG